MTYIGSSKVELIPNIDVGVAESSDTLQLGSQEHKISGQRTIH